MTLPLQTDNLTASNGSPLNGSSPLPVPPLSAEPRQGPSRSKAAPDRRWLYLLGSLLLAGGIGGTALLLAGGANADRADLLYHTVQLENLDLTIVERGTLESADNKDVISRVKASKGGNYATTIKWVIDDGTLVRAGQTVAILDSSALEDQLLGQKIIVEQKRGEMISAEENLKITESTNFSAEEDARTAIQVAELNLEKYVGLPHGSINRLPPPQAQLLLTEMQQGLEPFLAHHTGPAAATPAATGVSGALVASWLRFRNPKGDYQQAFDDVTGRIDLARAELENLRDRFAYSQRMEQKRYVSPSQVQSDESRMNSANNTFNKVQMERTLLTTFVARLAVKDFASKVEGAWRNYDVIKRKSRSSEVQAVSDRDTKRSVYDQETAKLEEIESQIKACKLVAPQDGMVVYNVPESSRWSQSERGLVQQGATVQENQKLIRIPDLKRMQVTTRVHEAMISRVAGDDRRSTGFSDSLRAAMLTTPDAFSRLFGQIESVQEEIREHYRDKEYYLASAGQKASVRVDAFSDRPLQGHVKTVATVAAQQDWSSSDVKVYQTIVSIDEPLYGLKPGMSAEVTILVENTGEKVAAIPVSAIVGGAESGKTRKVWVKTENGPAERDVVIGLSNDKMAEVREGLQPGDQVVINPKVLLGDKAKTRDSGEGSQQQFKKGNWGEGGKGTGGKKGGTGMKGGQPGAVKGGAPQGAAPGGPPNGGK